VKTDGPLWAWGANYEGQLGDGTKVDRYSPVQVPNFTNVTAAAGGYGHSLALKADGTVWAWGSGYFNQQGRGQKTDPTLRPIKITGLPPIKAIAANNNYTMALDAKGFIWVWGGDDYKMPTKIESLNLRQ